jgi:N utilization substance protein B
MQVLFAYSSQPDPYETLLHRLRESFSKSEQTFFILIDQLTEVIGYAATRKALASSSLLHEDEEIPELRLMDNPIFMILQGDEAWLARLRSEGINAFHDTDLTRHLFQDLGHNASVREYLARPAHTPEEDAEVMESILKDVLLDDDDFQSWLEEICPWWPDDADVLTSAATHFIHHLRETPLKKLLASLDVKAGETAGFAEDLLKKTLERWEEGTQLIGPAAINWEIERIAVIDMVLMKMALTEILEFPTIPVKVTINEYIDISKEYSTPKSREFINGVLDKLMHKLREEGRVVKSGRGLIET